MLNLKLKNKLNLKSLIIGVTLGITVSSFIPVFGAVQEYLLTRVNYPILVNGHEYKDEELPALNYNGNTFIPLRAVGDILEVEVNWNEELKRVEIGDVEVVENNIKNENVQENIIKNYNGDNLNYKNATFSENKLIPTISDFIEIDGMRYYNYYFLTTTLKKYSSNIKSTMYDTKYKYELYNDENNTSYFIPFSDVIYFNSYAYVYSEKLNNLELN